MKKIYCPVNGWDCPYYRKNGVCTIQNPIKDCDDFACFWDEDNDYFWNKNDYFWNDNNDDDEEE